MNFRNLYLLSASLVLPVCLLQAEPPEAPRQNRIDFNRDIRPILSNNCYPYHQPGSTHRR